VRPYPPESTVQDPVVQPAISLDTSRVALAGFVLSGLLLSFVGAILPSWGYHVTSDFTTVGTYFLSVNVGLVLSLWLAKIISSHGGIRVQLVLACSIAAASFLGLALSAPPFPVEWRLSGLFGLGLGAGLMNAAILELIAPLYARGRARAVNLAGALFGCGCLLTALLVAGTYYVYTVASVLILFALIPGLYAGIYLRTKISPEAIVPRPSVREVMNDFRNPGAVLFALLLFFQFGNEWSIAGWLPLVLIRRLGISPETSLFMLALFWTALLVGRLVAQPVRNRLAQGRLLMGSLLSAWLGCIILISTTNRFGAVMGILFVGFGFASIYPLVLEKIAHRFPYYHPGFYNGVVSLAFSGGMLAPWSLGYVADAWGIQAIMILPLVGTLIVFMLLLLILLEAKLSGAPAVKSATNSTT
jgi:MFS transporter, FHS family, glucose/mannose:H+ symporter